MLLARAQAQKVMAHHCKCSGINKLKVLASGFTKLPATNSNINNARTIIGVMVILNDSNWPSIRTLKSRKDAKKWIKIDHDKRKISNLNKYGMQCMKEKTLIMQSS